MDSEHIYILEMIFMVLGSAFMYLKRIQVRDEAWHLRKGIAVNIIEAAVSNTYNTYVREIKAARADGKLTEEEKANARTIAINTALDEAKKAGVNLVRDIGTELIDNLLETAVNRMKSKPQYSDI